MNDLMKSHIDYVKRLIDAINTYPDCELNQFSYSDDMCQLGTWIYDNKQKFGRNRDFSKLKDVHYVFHESATTVLLLLQTGSRTDAMKIVVEEMMPKSEEIKRLLGTLTHS